jgi:aspartoacylase
MNETPHTPFDTVFIVGGTHGNERTGVSLVQHWQQNPDEVQRTSFATRLLLANTEAIRRNIRFVDVDLNRSFLSQRLGDLTDTAYETGRAREMMAWMTTAHGVRRTFAIDLHTSTARMGVTLITNSDPINIAIAAEVQKDLRDARIYGFADSDRINSCLRAAAHGGIGVEIGPIPHGVVRHDTLDITRAVVERILTALDRFNRGHSLRPDPNLPIYRHDRHVAYPDVPPGAPPVFIHRAMEGRDYAPLQPGQPIFQDLSGRTWPYEGVHVRYPVFINEAAYYHANIAFSLTHRISLASFLTV